MAELTLQCTIVVVTLRGPGYRGGTLKDPVVMTIDGRKYLSGTSSSGKGHWSHGQRMHMALDEIASMVEFESEEAHAAKCSGARRAAHGIRRIFRRN